MLDDPILSPSYEEVRARSGIVDTPPYTHITFTLVAWNEEARLGPLLQRVRPYFDQLIVGVQQSDDQTLAIARQWADVVVEDEHRGFGDATFGPRLLPLVQSKWTFKLDADEWPSNELLTSLSNATWCAEQEGYDAIWIPFRSAVEGQAYNVDHSHLRLFLTYLDWPPYLHSRPKSTKDLLWTTGSIRHDRTLDEMVRDYLRYLEIGRGNPGWDKHNTEQITGACAGVAAAMGWAFVQGFEWWPQVAPLFGEDHPWERVDAAAGIEELRAADPVPPGRRPRGGVRQGATGQGRSRKVPG